MLKTRVITALVLLAILLPVLFLNNFALFASVALVFFSAGAWEVARLFQIARPWVWSAAWTLLCGLIIYSDLSLSRSLFALSVALWVFRFVPAFKFGLPPLGSIPSSMLRVTYSLALLGCFVAIVVFYQHSPLYLLSVMVIVWIADVGAYFAGKGFGRHKLAPSISPGKSWEGAVGGWLAVLVVAALMVMYVDGDTFAAHLYQHIGWTGFMVVMTALVAASIAGDLFESQLKRCAGVKDSSNLLPGHGGVLDRIDALVPVLPLAALIDLWL